MPISKLVDPDAYKFIVNKEDIPFVKGIKYYAYMDNPELYNNELSKLTDVMGYPIIRNKDGYCKGFIDYIVEFNSVNGIRYLHDKYDLKLKWFNENFNVSKHESNLLYFKNNMILTNIIASMKDAKLFFDIYDSYNMFVISGYYGGPTSFYENEEFITIILENEHLFNDIFNEKEYYHERTILEKHINVDSFTIKTINPIINVCLKCALENLDKYRSQAIKIIKFGIEHNKKVKEKLNITAGYHYLSDLGGVLSKDDNIVKDILIYCDTKSADNEILEMCKQLKI